MIFDSYSYITRGGVRISRSVDKMSMDIALEKILLSLDSHRGGLLASSYEYPGRYKRWAIGFVNPPLELTTCENVFKPNRCISRDVCARRGKKCRNLSD